jgi:hypothetical protein
VESRAGQLRASPEKGPSRYLLVRLAAVEVCRSQGDRKDRSSCTLLATLTASVEIGRPGAGPWTSTRCLPVRLECPQLGSVF